MAQKDSPTRNLRVSFGAWARARGQNATACADAVEHASKCILPGRRAETDDGHEHRGRKNPRSHE